MDWPAGTASLRLTSSGSATRGVGSDGAVSGPASASGAEELAEPHAVRTIGTSQSTSFIRALNGSTRVCGQAAFRGTRADERPPHSSSAHTVLEVALRTFR